MKTRSLALAVMVVCGAIAACADEIVLTIGTAHSGLFRGVTNHRFLFEAGVHKLSESLANLKTLTLDPPAKAVLKTTTGRTVSGTLSGIQDGKVGMTDEKGRAVAIPAMEVQSLTLPADFGRTMMADDVEVVSHGETIDPAAVVKRGRVTILHFHEPGNMASTRQGTYVASLAKRSRGAVVVLRIVVPNGQAPVAAALGLTSLPQFWFYDASGALAAKLTERFTEADLDAGVAAARRGAGGRAAGKTTTVPAPGSR